MYSLAGLFSNYRLCPYHEAGFCKDERLEPRLVKGSFGAEVPVERSSLYVALQETTLNFGFGLAYFLAGVESYCSEMQRFCLIFFFPAFLKCRSDCGVLSSHKFNSLLSLTTCSRFPRRKLM